MVPPFTALGFSENVAGLYKEMTAAFGTGTVKYDGAGRAVQGKVALPEVLAALRS
jgi:hypothetical protein